MSCNGRSILTSLAISIFLSQQVVSAGVIRHDQNDADYLSLGASYESVGQFQGTAPSYSFSASGVLIHPNWVLTAAHVVDEADSLTFNLGGGSHAAADWFPHPDWNGDLGKGYDVGLARFDVDLTGTGIVPAARYSDTGEVGRVGTAVGFGTTGTGLTGAINFDGQKRGGNNVIDSLLRTPGKDNRILLTDFDNSANAVYPNDYTEDGNNFGSSDPLDLEFMISPGSSGGGLFIDGLLAGITSFGWGRLDGDPDSDYDDVGGFTRVSSFNSWIDGFLSSGSGGGGGDDGGGGPPPGRGGGRPFAAATHITAAGVPEPATLSLLVLGGLGALLFARRR